MIRFMVKENLFKNQEIALKDFGEIIYCYIN